MMAMPSATAPRIIHLVRVMVVFTFLDVIEQEGCQMRQAGVEAESKGNKGGIWEFSMLFQPEPEL